jgi:serine/threonine protein kinase/Tol biopolymer transport system component
VTLSAGTRLGPYEMLGPLGAGGMGEVYRAKDTRLQREVAVKILPAELSSDAARLKRFETEARLASGLNHPNIVTIHEVGQSDSTSYIVMELVDGKTLRELLYTGPLPLRKLLSIAAQVADGLAKAHASDMVHRDLKPENVMITSDGFVKILDFGLAKLTHPESDKAQTEKAQTIPSGTEPGVVMGTVNYMSPEQATGQRVDFRSDQFSFGSILYEMATGKEAFEGKTKPETLAVIIRGEPKPIASVNAKVLPVLRWIIERCLAKEARNRFASTEDLMRDLAMVRDHLSELSGEMDSPAVPAPRQRQGRWILSALGLALAAILGIGVWRLARSTPSWENPLASGRFTRLTDWEGSELDAAISADGKFVTFLSDRDGPFDAWVGQVGSGDFRNLTKGQFPDLLNEEIRNVGFSDDDAHVWVRVSRKRPFGALRKMDLWFVPTMGGPAHPFLAEATLAVWSPDRSRIVYHTPDPGDPIFVADRNGANPKRLFIDKPGIHNHYPTWSPDGRFIYFVHGIPTTYDMDIWRIPSTGGEPERLTNHHALVAYPTSLDERTLLYTATSEAGSSLYVMDLQKRITRRVSFGLEEYISVAATREGRRLVATVANPERNLWTVPVSDHVAAESEAKRFPVPVVRSAAPRFGSDYLLFLSSKGTSQALWKFKDGAANELWRDREGSVVAAPAVSPGGEQIALVVRREGRSQLFVMSADGLNPHPMIESFDVRDAPSWSPDGKWIAVCANESHANPLLKLPAGGGPPIRLVEGVTYNPVWSPDGRLIVYSESHGGGSYQVRAVSAEGKPYTLPELWVRFAGDRYRFLPDGKGLVLTLGQARQQNFWMLDLATQRLRQLTDLRRGYDTKSFDVSPDGKQILFDRYRENSDVVLIDLPSR